MKKKLLVVGDSFMRPDPDFLGQHWSEMLPEYDVIMNSQSGASNGIIALQFYEGLKQNPDAVVMGFSFPTRIEFQIEDRWVTGANQLDTSADQQLLSELYSLHMNPEMILLKDCSIARGMFSVLTNKKIPFAWTLNGLFNNLRELPYPSNTWVTTILGDFFPQMTATNLTTYQEYKMSPGFHTDDPAWQQRFAQEARTILQNSLTL